MSAERIPRARLPAPPTTENYTQGHPLCQTGRPEPEGSGGHLARWRRGSEKVLSLDKRAPRRYAVPRNGGLCMSKMMVNFEQLRQADTKRLLEYEHQLLGALDREIQGRREAKRSGKKKRGRPRRSSSR